MKWSKRLECLTEKGEFSPHAFPISGWSPKQTLGASWHWQVCIIPRQGSCHKWYEITSEPKIGTQILLHTCVPLSINHTHKHTIELVMYSRKCVCQENKELELQATLPCPEESQMSSQDERLLLSHERWWDSWPLEEKNSIWGQWWDLITPSFCVIKLY